jgi:hypothetical protein
MGVELIELTVCFQVLKFHLKGLRFAYMIIKYRSIRILSESINRHLNSVSIPKNTIHTPCPVNQSHFGHSEEAEKRRMS